jgi:hypothetical protein
VGLVSPFPGHRVIPAGWAEHNRGPIEAAMTARCVVLPGASGPAPYKSGTSAPAAPPAPLYDGPCAVTPVSAGTTVLQAEQLQRTSECVVTFPIDLLPKIAVGDRGSLVRITECEDDAQLVGRTFRAVSVQYSSSGLERAVTCVDNQTQG